MKKIFFSISIIIIFAANSFSKINMSIIETKDFYNSDQETILSMQKQIETIFSSDNEFSVRVNPKKFLEEIQLVLAGVSDGKTDRKMMGVDYIVISGIGIYGDYAVISIRIADIDTYKIIAGKSKICKKEKMLETINKTTEIVKENIKKYLNEKKKNQINNSITARNFTVYKFAEQGKKGISRAIVWMLSSDMACEKGISLIEREGANFVMKEKELELAGLVNRNPLKKYRKMYQVDFSIDGIVISEFEDFITVTAKVVDAATSRVLFTVYAETPSIPDLEYLIRTIIRKINQRLDNFCKFEIITEPKNVSIFIDDIYVGRSDVLITDIEAGKHTIRVEKRDYETEEFAKTALRWQTTKIYKELKKQEKKYYKMGLAAERKKEWDNAIENFEKFIEK